MVPNTKFIISFDSNNAMAIFKALKDITRDNALVPRAPREVAQTILNNIPANNVVERFEIANTGFINAYLSKKWVSQRTHEILMNGVRATNIGIAGKRVLIDFSSPNVAKEMHVGHLRSTIIGDTLSRLMEFFGCVVLRINHVGDWGTQFGMLIAYLKVVYPDFINNPPLIGDLVKFYKAAKKVFDSDEEFKSKAHQEVVALQSGNNDSLIAWKLLCDVSRKEFEKIYERLNVHLQEKGESFYNPIIPVVIHILEEKALAKESDGAMCIFIEGKDMPLIIKKSDGGFSYDSTDMAAIWYRIFDQKIDWIIYVTDMGQRPHFDLIFEAATRAGWVKPNQPRLDHVGFGLMLGKDGKKIKTREGESVRLVDLLDEAVARSTTILEERIKSGESPLPADQIPTTSKSIGYGAVKYADLRQNRITDYVFDYDRMLDVKGNTAVYLLYAYARICSIIRKAGVDIDTIKKDVIIDLEHPSEFNLAFALLRFHENLEIITADLSPNHLCDYIYDLSAVFNEFHRDCWVIGDPKQNPRLLLCAATIQIFDKAFELLGITPISQI